MVLWILNFISFLFKLRCTEDLCGLKDICDEKLVRSIADAIKDQGLDELGYKYVTLDDCWADTSRD